MSEHLPKIIAACETNKERIADHEARLRIQERWAADHDAWAKARWTAQDATNSRYLHLIERMQDKNDERDQQLGLAFTEIGKLKVRIGFVMAAAGAVGGIVSTVIGSLILWALGVVG